MEFLSYGKQWIEQDDIDAVVETLKSDYMTQGPKVSEFEEALCRETGAKYAVAVANGTAALHLAVLALELEAGSEGITSPNTFTASSNCMAYCGVRPRFADISPKTYCVTPETLSEKISDKTRLLIPVHFAGQAADMVGISELAKEKGLRVIEDAAHAIGSTYADGSPVGICKYSDMTIFSFHPVKVLTTAEGGAVTTNDDALYEKLCLLRTHGITKNPDVMAQNPGPWYYEMIDLGFNYRITDLQCALGITQLSKLGRFKDRRREIVAAYNEAFAETEWLTTPFEREGLSSAFHLYVLLIDFQKIGKSRAEVMAELREKKIGTQVHYIPVHLQPYYQKTYGTRPGDFPIAEDYYEHCLSIPLYPKMSDEDVSRVISAVKALHE